MYNGAHAEICGILGKDLEIRQTKNGRYYGIIIIAVNKFVRIDSESNKPVFEPNWFPVFIWENKILDKYSLHLKKGTNIAIKADLEIFNRPTLEGDNISRYDSHQPKNIVVTIRKKNSIKILAKLSNNDKENLASAVNDNEIVDLRFLEEDAVDSTLVDDISKTIKGGDNDN